MSKKTVVVVEDEPDILDVLRYSLKREGFEVASALDDNIGLKLIHNLMPDLVLLDLMLPGMDSLETTRGVGYRFREME